MFMKFKNNNNNQITTNIYIHAFCSALQWNLIDNSKKKKKINTKLL